jgi:putative membrane protein
MMRYGWYGYQGPGLLGWGLGVIAQIGVWLIIGIVIVSVVKHLHNKESDYETQTGKALDILKERYAKGELTKKEFEDMKKDIS